MRHGLGACSEAGIEPSRPHRLRARPGRASAPSARPPTDEQSAAFAAGLRLGAAPLEPLRFHPVAWRAGDVFGESDDPDRTREPFSLPSFLSRDPAEQLAKVWCEELPVPQVERSALAGTFARVVHGVLDERDCAELISLVNEKGFTPALTNIGGGRQKLLPNVRNGHRVIVDSAEIGGWLFEVLRPCLPGEMRGGPLVELNERLRVLCYTPGQRFETHIDGSYRRPLSHPRAGDTSRVTVQVYLHDVPEENGGATTFDFGSSQLPCQPRAGSVLIFSQDLPHEGSVLREGVKYTLRTEAMYGL